MRRAWLFMTVSVAAAATAGAQERQAVWPWDMTAGWHEAVAWDHTADGGPARTLQAAWAALRVGDTAGARSMLDALAEADADSLYVAPRLAQRAFAALVERQPGQAAALFADAAALTGGSTRGVLLARAGAAYELAGLDQQAATAYAGAARLMPTIIGWIALRAAAVVGSDVRADSLLAFVPVTGAGLAQEVRAQVRLRTGDSLGALDAFVAAGRPHDAVRIALGLADTSRARALAYDPGGPRDTAMASVVFAVARSSLPPIGAEDALVAARAAALLGEDLAAADYAGGAVAAGDSSPATLEFWGDLLERSGRRARALAAYAAAGPDGAFPRARALLRLGRRSEAQRAFLAFVAVYPDHRRAPWALYLAADIASSDSLLAEVASRWPAVDFASRARVRLATRRLQRADTAGAATLYRQEIESRGEQAGLARYRLAVFHRSDAGDTPDGRAPMEALARSDSVGYYGMIARASLDMPLPRFTPPPVGRSSAAVAGSLAELDLLDATGFTREADALVAGLVARSWSDPDELLDLAEGLTVRHRAALGIRLGWRAAGVLTLNHPRVIRAIFPWPHRAMIEAEATKFDIDPYLLAAVIRQESSFEAEIRSRAGAIGFMQLMPPTARDVARRLNVRWDDAMFAVADANVHVGAAHLAGLLRQYRGVLAPALAAYNAGGSRATRWLALPGAADPVVFVERIPFVETQGYVRAVLRNRDLYRALYPPSPVP
ncbi:MAG TPA: transglycosylase SLT domain-containing protein [Gemmatimonadales bacterium]